MPTVNPTDLRPTPPGFVPGIQAFLGIAPPDSAHKNAIAKRIQVAPLFKSAEVKTNFRSVLEPTSEKTTQKSPNSTRKEIHLQSWNRLSPVRFAFLTRPTLIELLAAATELRGKALARLVLRIYSRSASRIPLRAGVDAKLLLDRLRKAGADLRVVNAAPPANSRR